MNDLQVVDTHIHDADAAHALVQARALTIVTVEDYRSADSLCRGWFELRRAIEADFAESLLTAKKAKKSATEALAALVEQIGSHIEPVQEAERIVKAKLLTWSREQEELRRKEQDRLRIEAQKKAEDDRLNKAEALQAMGKTDRALAELDKPVKVAAIIAAPAPTERETKISSYWSYEIIDPGEVKREFCSPDRGIVQKSMNSYKAMGKSIREVEEMIGGIRIEEKVK